MTQSDDFPIDIPDLKELATKAADSVPDAADDLTSQGVEDAEHQKLIELAKLSAAPRANYITNIHIDDLKQTNTRLVLERDNFLERCDRERAEVERLRLIENGCIELRTSKRFWRWIAGSCTFCMALGGVALGAYSKVDEYGHHNASVFLFATGCALVILPAFIELGVVLRNL
ncbi:hypothetical protein [Tautonia rosea]|uniref:hypothetical protein n=1 Tax=Tautonia rosea TaxID=2728037 RepID=UPI0014733D0E|nr:hypothetical protein [Tautonia rosea]